MQNFFAMLTSSLCFIMGKIISGSIPFHSWLYTFPEHLIPSALYLLKWKWEQICKVDVLDSYKWTAQTTQLADHQHCIAGGSDTLIVFLPRDISHDVMDSSMPWKPVYSD